MGGGGGGLAGIPRGCLINSLTRPVPYHNNVCLVEGSQVKNIPYQRFNTLLIKIVCFLVVNAEKKVFIFSCLVHIVYYATNRGLHCKKHKSILLILIFTTFHIVPHFSFINRKAAGMPSKGESGATPFAQQRTCTTSVV